MIRWNFLAVALLGSIVPATVQEVTTPSLAVPDNQLGDARKYFILHKSGISLEKARDDLTFCWRFIAHGQPQRMPGFVPWQEPGAAQQAKRTLVQLDYVKIAGVFGGAIAGPLERSTRQSRMFRCMVPRGYARYRTSQAIWNELNTGDAVRSIQLQAQIAVGPVPPTPRVLP